METGVQCQEPAFKHLALVTHTSFYLSELKMLLRDMKFVRGVFFLLSLHITFFKYIYETSAKLFSNALILPILNATYLCREL